MLKAYSYIESDKLDSGIVDRDVFAKEKQLITEFAFLNPSPKVEAPCILCGHETKGFDMIDNVYYQRCCGCYSIFAKVDDDIIESYKRYQPLLDFRNTDKYQVSAAIRREIIWNDLLFWLEFRLARYISKKSGVSVIDHGNRYTALADRIKKSKFCSSYNSVKKADVVLFFDQFRCLSNPSEALFQLREMLVDNGLLIMNMRVGSGFDVLAIKGSKDNFYPYEVICLPSIEGLDIVLSETGFDILEISTPGTLDIEHVMQNKEYLDEDDLFVHYLLNKADGSMLAEFQRFLQKSGMSSHARVIARKRSVQNG